jgi:hypothetical protein
MSSIEKMELAFKDGSRAYLEDEKNRKKVEKLIGDVRHVVQKMTGGYVIVRETRKYGNSVTLSLSSPEAPGKKLKFLTLSWDRTQFPVDLSYNDSIMTFDTYETLEKVICEVFSNPSVNGKIRRLYGGGADLPPSVDPSPRGKVDTRTKPKGRRSPRRQR